jgi:hypothetical protein
MGSPVYAVCERCEFLRAFAGSASRKVDGRLPRRCPACGREISVHDREERFPSTYVVGRVSRALHATPPLGV